MSLPENKNKPDSQMLAGLIQVAHSLLLKDNGLESVAIFFKDTEMKVVPVSELGLDMNSPEDKAMLNSFIKTTSLQEDVDMSVLITEAWMTKIQAVNAEEALRSLNGRVSDLPRERRTEVIIISAHVFRPVAERWAGTFEIIRDTNGAIHNFGPTEWMLEKTGNSLTGLLSF